ncbi:MAG: universal stress protein [Curvibacter sp.]|nr:universal stress protein [Curvibacter sp.]
MSLKNVLVHLGPEARTAARLELAVALARQHGARLVGVFAQRAQAHQVGVISTWPSPAYVQARDASQALFEQATAGLAGAQWQDLNRGADAEVCHRLTDLARYADLVVMGQREPDDTQLPEDLVSEVILHSGRPVLVVPYVGRFPTLGKNPLLGWAPSREAARALADALPLIAGCELAHVLSISTRPEEAGTTCPDIERYLASHGITARAKLGFADELGPMDLLLNGVTDVGADLLVMGAQAPRSLPFDSRGSGTQHILRHMTVPVLMSH